MSRRYAARVFLAFSIVLLTGCSQSGGSPEGGQADEDASQVQLDPLPGGEPALDELIVTAGNPATVSMPLDAYRFEDAKARLVSRAQVVVGDKCMAEFGFSPLPGWIPEGTVPSNPYAKYGVWDEGSVAIHGYNQPPVEDENRYPIRFRDQDAQDVWWGRVESHQGRPVPEGGCRGKEVEAVMGGIDFSEVDGRFQVDLESEALTRATQDSRVVPLLAAWRTCMKDAGWDYADPQAPFAYWSDKRGSDKHQAVISDEEKRSAVKDTECKKSTGLLGTWIAAEVAYQKVLIERDWEELRVYKKHLDDVVKRANNVLAEAGQHP